MNLYVHEKNSLCQRFLFVTLRHCWRLSAAPAMLPPISETLKS